MQASPFILAAAYYAGCGRKTLLIERVAGGRRTVLEEIAVAGRREARRIAAERGAKPWNF